MAAALDSSLVRSGPFYRFLRRLKLIRGERRDLIRQFVALLAITWAPFVVLELLRSGLRVEEMKFLRNVSVHGRFLVAMPLLLAAEEALHRLCARAIRAFAEGRFAREGDRDPTVPLVEQAIKWTSSAAVEAALAVACFGTQIGVWAITHKIGILPQAVIEAGLPPGQA